MKNIKLMADYGCDPIWKQPPYGVGNVQLNSLPISKALCEALAEWASEYDHTFDPTYPPNSGFETQAAADKFDAMGFSLLARLRIELGPDFQVEYFPNAHCKG